MFPCGIVQLILIEKRVAGFSTLEKFFYLSKKTARLLGIQWSGISQHMNIEASSSKIKQISRGITKSLLKSRTAKVMRKNRPAKLKLCRLPRTL